MHCETQQQGDHDNQSMICDDFHARSRGTTQFFPFVSLLRWTRWRPSRNAIMGVTAKRTCGPWPVVTLFNIAN